MTSAVASAIDDLQRSGRLHGTALYAFGHTAATEEMRSRLDRYQLALTGVLDNNVAKQGGSMHGVPVIEPAVMSDTGVPSVVLIASRFHDEMRRQLLDLGFAGEIIRVGDLSITTDVASTENVSRGARRLDLLRAAHPDRHLIVCPFNALGDVYWALAYLPPFVTSRHLEPAVPVVVGESGREVARLFGHEEVHSLTQVEMDELVAAIVADPAQDVTIAHHDRPYGDGAPVRMLDERFVGFSDIYRDLVYKLPPGSRPHAPRRDAPAEADRCDRSWAVGIPQGRTVLLAPYAKSVLPVPWAFWEETAERHSAQGYTVASVVHGDEDPVPGTGRLDVPLPQLLDAVEHAGTFISLRSGLCDVLHSTRSRKVHVFPDALYSTTSHKVADFFALPGWESVVVDVD